MKNKIAITTCFNNNSQFADDAWEMKLQMYKHIRSANDNMATTKEKCIPWIFWLALVNKTTWMYVNMLLWKKTPGIIKVVLGSVDH